MKVNAWMTGLAIGSAMAVAQAQDKADDVTGYWMTAQRDGVVQLARCPLYNDAPPTGLCGVIVWDVEVDNSKRSQTLDCNRKVFEATRFDTVPRGCELRVPDSTSVRGAGVESPANSTDAPKQPRPKP